MQPAATAVNYTYILHKLHNNLGGCTTKVKQSRYRPGVAQRVP